ncbi:hypothetical protein FACS189437_00040 [Bacteroidia bacterium]|nr:hypothetical protein FACS189437_00040 [Bacteroidia bacterium]
MFGNEVRNNNQAKEFVFHKIPTVIYFSIWVVVICLNGTVNVWDLNVGNNFLLYLTGGGIGTLLVVRGIRYIAKDSIVIRTFSIGTLPILALHWVLFRFLVRFNFSFIDPLLLSMIVLLLLYYPIKLADKYFPLSLGKRK